MARKMVIRMGVPKLGVVTFVCDLDNKVDCEALDLNVANGCAIYSMQPYPTLECLQDKIKLTKFD